MRLRRHALLSVALAALTTGSVAHAAEPVRQAAGVVATAVDQDDLLLLALELDQLTLTDTLAVYGDPSDPFIPLGELTRLLDLDVSFSPGRVTGRLGQPSRLLDLDVRTGLGRVGGRELALSPADFKVGEGELFLRSSTLGALLPIKVQVDAEALSLKLVATETLPVQARLERATRIGGLQSNEGDDGPVMRLEAPYRLASAPVFDVALDLSTSTRDGKVRRRYDVRSAGDFAGAGYQGYVGSDDNGEVTDLRLVFEKRDAGGRLLGPLRATSWSAGDVFTPGLAIGPHSQGGGASPSAPGRSRRRACSTASICGASCRSAPTPSSM